MPLFSMKFSPKKIPPRKQQMSVSSLRTDTDAMVSSQDFDINYGPIKMKLGDQECSFQDGQWIITGGPDVARDTIKLKKHNEKLKEENNLLKLKVDLLLDMLAESTAELELQEVELEKFRTGRRSKK